MRQGRSLLLPVRRDHAAAARRISGSTRPKLVLTFQSRFGRAKWLQPYTDETVRRSAAEGVKRMAVVTPGFSADCLETLEEIAVENARDLQAERRREFRRHALPQRQRARHAGDLAAGAARAQGLGVSLFLMLSVPAGAQHQDCHRRA